MILFRLLLIFTLLICQNLKAECNINKASESCSILPICGSPHMILMNEQTTVAGSYFFNMKTIECKICNNQASKFGFHFHLKTHNYTTKEYYLEYIGKIVKCHNPSCNKEGKFRGLGGFDKTCSKECYTIYRKILFNTPEMKLFLSVNAKKNGYGKWMKGKKQPPEVIEKRTLHRRGKTYEEVYGDRAAEIKNKLRISNTGIKHNQSEEGKERVRQHNKKLRKGKTYTEIFGEERGKEINENRKKIFREKALKNRKKLEQRPKHNATFEYVDWRTSVFQNDNYTCQICNEKKQIINAHHIKPWSNYPESRFDISNGITTCLECHEEIHRQMKKEVKRLKQLNIIERNWDIWFKEYLKNNSVILKYKC